jgi:uncharacterized protein (TIGR00369 family)
METPLEMLRRVGHATTRFSPQAAALGLALETVEPGEALMRLPYDPKIVGDPESGVIAGGAVTTLLDHVCGQAVWAALNTWTPIATLDLRIDYMRAAEPGKDVLAQAHCYKLTRHVGFVRAVAYDVSPDDPVATAQAAFALNRPGSKGSSEA